jgi:uncharacterized protein DUF6516
VTSSAAAATCKRLGSSFASTADFPEGLRYSLSLINLASGKTVLRYDIHRGKSHHRHLRDAETPYDFVDEETLVEDFLRDVDLILEGKL